MSGAYSRTKGHSFERHTAIELRPVFPKAKRGNQRNQEVDECDIEKTPYWVECKKGKNPSIRRAYRQAALDKAKCHDPRPIVVITQVDREEKFATMLFSDWLALNKRIYCEK